MKKARKQIISFSITFPIILLVIVLSFGAYILLERMYPNRMLELRREFMYLGLNIELDDYKGQTIEVDFDELINRSNVTFDNTMILVSSEHPIMRDLSFDSVSEYKDTDVFFDSSAHASFSELSEYVQVKFEEKLFVTSAYRTNEEQKELFENQGSDTAQRPGESEHQTGLAIDIAVKGYGGLSFLKTEAGKYVNLFAWKYGFIIRYPEGKTGITKIDYEPWHIRYVGKPHAEFIEINRLTLEEYIEMLSPENLFYINSNDEYCVIKTKGYGKISIPENYKSLTVSPDNCGNYILTFLLH